MAKEELTTKQETTKSSSGRSHRQKKDKSKPLTKIVIRHLPPTMTEAEFLNQIDPLPEHHDYYYVNADWSLGFDATCRAYLTLKNYDDVFLFRDRFDGYVFVDSKGVEYPAIVEFAPFQGPVKDKHTRTDFKVNTIHQEAHFTEFLAKLEEEREAAAKGGETKLEFSLDRKKDEITSTPLLQYLSMKKEKRREEAKKRSEEKRRQREEEKDRRSQPQVTKILQGRDNRDGRDGRDGRDRRDSGKPRDKPSTAANSKEDDLGKSQSRRATRSKRKTEQKQKERDERDDQHRRHGSGRDQGADREKDKDKANKSRKHNHSKGEDKFNGRGGKGEETNAKDKVAVNDVVKNFIMSVALPKDATAEENTASGVKLLKVTAKEFVPEVKRSDEAADKKTAAQESEVLQDVREKLEKISITGKQDGRKGENTPSSASEERRLQRQRAAEERRIRNKDRPSIQIYQPKPRGVLSEERELSQGKEGWSNPTSDCESVKREEQRSKKVARYSERRSERRTNNREKHRPDDERDPAHKDARGHSKNLKKSQSSDNCAADKPTDTSNKETPTSEALVEQSSNASNA